MRVIGTPKWTANRDEVPLSTIPCLCPSEPISRTSRNEGAGAIAGIAAVAETDWFAGAGITGVCAFATPAQEIRASKAMIGRLACCASRLTADAPRLRFGRSDMSAAPIP